MAAFVTNLGIVFWEVFFLVPMGRGTLLRGLTAQECEQTFEVLWRAERRPVRRLYQGILQVGVAFHHLRRFNHHGTVYMLTRGSMYLRPFAPVCQAVDVAKLLADAGRALDEVERLGPARLGIFDWRLAPKVCLLTRTGR